jgi:PAS domain S-box-containing protein
MGESLSKQVLSNEKILDSISDWFTIIDLDSNIRYTNKSGEKLFGLTKDKIINQKCCKLVHNKYTLVKDCPLKKMLKSKKQENSELYLPEKNYWYGVTVIPIFDKNKKITGAVHIVRDITEGKLAYKALQDSQLLFERFKDASTESFSIWDSDFNLVDVNKFTLKTYLPPGTKKEDIIGKNILDIIPNLDKLNRYKKYLKVMKTGIPISYDDIVLHPILGGQHISIKVFKVGDGLGVIADDITEKKIAKEKLKKSEEKYRSIVDSSNNVIIRADCKGVINYINHTVTGLSKEEVIDKTLYDYIDSKYHNLVRETLEKVVNTGKPSSYELQGIGPRGTTAWYHSTISPIIYDGKINAVTIVTEDITNQKKADEIIKESEVKYRTLFETSPEGLLTMNLKGFVTRANSAFFKLSGYSKKEIIGKHFTRLPVLRKRDLPRYIKLFASLLKKGEIDPIEYRWIHKSGDLRWGDGYFGLLKYEGKKIGVQLAVVDTTERKKAGIALKESEEKYKLIIKTAPTIITIINNDFIIKDINYTVSGIDKKDVIGKKIFEFLEPRFHKKVEKTLQNVIKTKKSSQYEAQGKGPNNSIVWYDTRVGPIIKDGKVTEIIIMGNDITERKKREREIQKQFLKYDIEEGNCYLVLEKSNIKATNAFDDVLKTGYNGIIISRKKLKDLKTRINNDFSYLWLSERLYNNSIKPKSIEKYIEQIKKPSVILLERFDYIIQKLGFNKTLSLLQNLNEIAYMKNHIILISIDPDIIDNKELSLIEKETIELEPRQKLLLDDDQIRILKYIFKQNLLTNKPSYTDLCDNLHTSKPTMRNKIRTLKEKGYLIEYKSGNKKLLEISEKTRSLLT